MGITQVEGALSDRWTGFGTIILTPPNLRTNFEQGLGVAVDPMPVEG